MVALVLSLPVGVSLDALGLSVIAPIVTGDTVHVGLVAFGRVLAQGILVGIIFGMVTSKIKKLHIYNKRKGVTMGLATGITAYLVLFVTVTMTIFHIPTISGSYLSTILGYGLFAYLIYGFILEGILLWTFSVYDYVLTKLAQLEKNPIRRPAETLGIILSLKLGVIPRPMTNSW